MPSVRELRCWLQHLHWSYYVAVCLLSACSLGENTSSATKGNGTAIKSLSHPFAGYSFGLYRSDGLIDQTASTNSSIPQDGRDTSIRLDEDPMCTGFTVLDSQLTAVLDEPIGMTPAHCLEYLVRGLRMIHNPGLIARYLLKNEDGTPAHDQNGKPLEPFDLEIGTVIIHTNYAIRSGFGRDDIALIRFTPSSVAKIRKAIASNETGAPPPIKVSPIIWDDLGQATERSRGFAHTGLTDAQKQALGHRAPSGSAPGSETDTGPGPGPDSVHGADSDVPGPSLDGPADIDGNPIPPNNISSQTTSQERDTLAPFRDPESVFAIGVSMGVGISNRFSYSGPAIIDGQTVEITSGQARTTDSGPTRWAPFLLPLEIVTDSRNLGILLGVPMIPEISTCGGDSGGPLLLASPAPGFSLQEALAQQNEAALGIAEHYTPLGFYGFVSNGSNPCVGSATNFVRIGYSREWILEALKILQTPYFASGENEIVSL